MPYINQVDALLTTARGRLANAMQRANSWPDCGMVLARAFENAVCAVYMAWDDPYKPGKKMHNPFYDRLMPLINQPQAELIRFVWEREGRGRPDIDVDRLLAACDNVIEYLADLAASEPPAGWELRPIPEPVGWDSLSDEERSFLEAALQAARLWVPGVRLVLFGSRAGGTAGPTSDYDVLFVFPDQAQDQRQGQAIGEVDSLARALGIELDVEKSAAGDWQHPPEVSRPLIGRIKQSGIEVPG
jgi:predicted nucleotidyltransferase